MRFSQPRDDSRASSTRNAIGSPRPIVHTIPTRSRRLLAPTVLLCATVVACLHPALLTAQGPRPPSASIQREATQAVPLAEMNEAVRNKLGQVLSSPTLFRRLPAQAIDCDPDMYIFLVRYPEVVVNIWQLMGVTKVQVSRTGDYTFDATDGAGTVSKVELAYGRPDIHVFYADGVYEGPLLKNRMTGRCVAVLHSDYERRDGRVVVSNYMDVFVQLDNVGAELLVKALQPLFGKAADFNFLETAKFLGQISLASEMNGPGMQRLADKLTNCTPNIRQAFSDHTEAIYQRAVLQQNAQAIGGTPSLFSRLQHASPAEVGLAPTRSTDLQMTPRDHQSMYRR